MKYSEFKANIEALGYEIKNTISKIYVESTYETVISVDKRTRFSIDVDWTGFSQEPEDVLLAIFNHACELAKTPPTEREEEKRYYLRKIPVPLLKESGNRYFCKPLSPNYPPRLDGDRRKSSRFQNIFTESEISQMDITGFERVEVIP